MPTSTFTTLYLGNVAEIDTNEAGGATRASENPNAMFDPVFNLSSGMQILAVDFNDDDGDGRLQEDTTYLAGGTVDQSGLTESLTYDLGSGSVTSVMDYVAVVNYTVTLQDDSTVSQLGVVMQTQNGDLFLEDFSGPGLNNLMIKNISIDSINNEFVNHNTLPNPDILNSTVICFAGGTSIETAHAATLVENLRPGDLIKTMKGEMEPLVSIETRRVTQSELARNPKLHPVRITAGALGCGLPKRDLLVSRQHRMLVSSKVADRMVGTEHVLIAAIRLAELPGIYVDDTFREIQYFHLLLNRHEVVFANGAPSESLLCGPLAMDALSGHTRWKVSSRSAVQLRDAPSRRPAFPIPSGKQQKHLVKRLSRNKKGVLDSNWTQRAIWLGFG